MTPMLATSIAPPLDRLACAYFHVVDTPIRPPKSATRAHLGSRARCGSKEMVSSLANSLLQREPLPLYL